MYFYGQNEAKKSPKQREPNIGEAEEILCRGKY